MDKEQVNKIIQAGLQQAIDAAERRLKAVVIREIERRFNKLREGRL